MLAAGGARDGGLVGVGERGGLVGAEAVAQLLQGSAQGRARGARFHTREANTRGAQRGGWRRRSAVAQA